MLLFSLKVAFKFVCVLIRFISKISFKAASGIAVHTNSSQSATQSYPKQSVDIMQVNFGVRWAYLSQLLHTLLLLQWAPHFSRHGTEDLPLWSRLQARLFYLQEAWRTKWHYTHWASRRHERAVGTDKAELYFHARLWAAIEPTAHHSWNYEGGQGAWNSWCFQCSMLQL